VLRLERKIRYYLQNSSSAFGRGMSSIFQLLEKYKNFGDKQDINENRPHQIKAKKINGI
jgi:hypothetical protein